MKWNDTRIAETVEEKLSKIDSFVIWDPEELDLIRKTQSVDFVVREDEFEKANFDEIQVEYNVLIEDVNALIQNENTDYLQARSTDSILDNYSQYLDFEDIENWLFYITERYPALTKLEVIGQSVEERNLYGLTISEGDAESNGKESVFIECGIHAREWVSPAACRYFIYQLLAASANDFEPDNSLPYSKSDLVSLTELNWHIILEVNPDGYQYTHNNDRMWRKNRSFNPGEPCRGTDLNRNFPVGHLTRGGGSNSCSFSYANTAPMNQPESQAWDAWIKKIQKHAGPLMAQLSIHSYSQLLMPPYATTRKCEDEDNMDNIPCDQVRPDDPETLEYLMCISDKMKAAIHETHGKEYTTGQSRDVVGYAAGGTTEDYAYDDLQIPLTWVVELRDTGDYGFLLPSNQIIPTAEELTNAFIQMFKEIKSSSCKK